MDPEDDRQGPVDLADGLEHPRVAGLRETLALVLLRHVEPERPDLAEVAQDLVRDPALLLRTARVVVLLAVLPDPDVEVLDPVLLLHRRLGPGEHQLLADLSQEE